MQDLIDKILGTDEYIVEKYIKIYKEVFSYDNEKNYLFLKYLIEHSDDSTYDKEGETYTNDEAFNQIGGRYYLLLREMVKAIARKNPCPEAFYQSLYNGLFSSGVLDLGERDWGVILLLLSKHVKGLPYYQANDAIRLSDEKFAEILNDIAPGLDKAIYMINDRFEFKTELTSQLIDICDGIEGRDKKSVFWAAVLGTIQEQAAKMKN
jgi:hypothetical protein